MANLRIAEPGWDQLSAASQGKIKEILVDTKLLDAGDAIVYDPAAVLAAFSIPDSVCKAACAAAEGVATAACAMLPYPDNLICIAAARAGGEMCKAACASLGAGPANP